MTNTAINIVDLTVYYRDSLALDQVSTSIQKGELLAVVGPNGAGKSTLIKSIMQQLKPYSGCVELAGVNPKSIAYLPQSNQIDRKFPISVCEFVSAGAWKRTGFWRRFCCLEKIDLEQALIKVNLKGFEDRQINTLSDGQFQRVLFARMLMQDAEILLLDEPFNAIDAQTTEELIEVINHCQQEGKTVIAVIHDLLLVQRFFPNTMLLATQLIANGKTELVMTPENLAKAGYQYWNEAVNNNPLNQHSINNRHSTTSALKNPIDDGHRNESEISSGKSTEVIRERTTYDS